MSSLIVLDSATPGRRPDPYRVLREHSWTMQVFETTYYTPELGRALSAVTDAVRDRRNPVVVIGPTFLDGYGDRKETLRKLFADAGLTSNRFVFIHSPGGLPMMCEYEGEFSMSVPDVVFYASGLRYEGGYRPKKQPKK